MTTREQQGKLRQRLRGMLGKRRHLRLTVEGVKEPIHGYPLAVSRHLVTLLAMNDFLPDGLAWLPLRRIVGVRQNAKDIVLERRAEDLARVPEELPQVDLGRRGDWLDALVPLQKRGEVLEVQRAGHDSVSLGTIEKLTADTLALRTFDEQGTLGREPGAYRWRDVAVVTSGTDYIEVYKRFLKSGEAPLSSGELTKRARSVDLDARGSDVRGALEQAAKTGQYVRLHRVFDGPSGCVILRVGPELVLARGYSELVCDPLEVLRLRDIERVESGPSEHIKTYLLRRERRLPKGKPRVDIRSVSSVLASAGALVIIEREAEGDFFLGRLRRGGKHRSQVEYLAFEGGFQKPESIDHSDVTRIELDSDYLRVSVQSLEKQG